LIFSLKKELYFPPVHLAEPDGLLAMGGDLSPERILLAYSKGIFPWFEGDVPLWWATNPRFVIFPEELKVSKSMKQVLKSNAFSFTVNKDCMQVITHCGNIKRDGQRGTWITQDIKKTYFNLHQQGYVSSAETWQDGQLVGGLYGIRIGNVFCGESMFSLVNNASKYAFINYVQLLKEDGVQLIDCQIYTPHLESLGGKMISLTDYLKYLPT
jgi:leucyl/phenylalanyl-tRNA--protein transferase